MKLKKEIQKKIEKYNNKKKELDEIKAIFVKPKKKRPALTAIMIILLLMMIIPTTIFLIDNTTIKTTTIYRTIKEQPIKKIYPTTNNTIIINKTIYKYPEKKADCTIVRIINNGTQSKKYLMHCEVLKNDWIVWERKNFPSQKRIL